MSEINKDKITKLLIKQKQIQCKYTFLNIGIKKDIEYLSFLEAEKQTKENQLKKSEIEFEKIKNSTPDFDYEIYNKYKEYFKAEYQAENRKNEIKSLEEHILDRKNQIEIEKNKISILEKKITSIESILNEWHKNQKLNKEIIK